MLALLGVLAVFSGAGERAPTPSLCVRAELLPSSSLEVRDLAQALRARIARRQLLVTRCEEGDGVEPDWRLLVKQLDERSFSLVIEGATRAERTIQVKAGAKPFEIAQLLAVTAAEIVQPALDQLLARLNASRDPTDEAIASLEARAAEAETREPETPPAVENTSEVPETPSEAPATLSLHLDGGTVIWPASGHVLGHLDAGLGVRSGIFGLASRLGLHRFPESSRDDANLAGVRVEVALAVGVTLEPVEFAAYGVLRAAMLELEEGGTEYSSTFWTGGFGAEVRAPFLQWGAWRSGPTLRCTLWPGPGRFLARGRAIAREEFVELTLAWAVAWDAVDLEF